MYMSEIWGPCYTDIIERGQMKFLKLLLHLPSNTPNAYVRLETGRTHLKLKVFSKMVGWWVQILKLSRNRLPYIVFKSLKVLSNCPSIPYNWALQLKKYLTIIGKDHLWECEDYNIIKNCKKDIIAAFSNHLLSIDLDFAINSTFNLFYRNVSSLGPQEFYLNLIPQINKIRLFSQIRLSSKRNVRLYINRCK